MTPIQEIVNYYYELKDMDEMSEEWYKENNIRYSRFTKPAKDLLQLCNNDVEKAKDFMERICHWTEDFGGEWEIETVTKKYLELEAGMI